MARPFAYRHRQQADHAQLHDALAYAETIVDTVREPLLVLDKDLRIRSANRSFYRTFHVLKEDTENRLLYELGNGQWNIPQLRVLLEELIPRETTIEDFEVQHDFPYLGSKVMLLNARKLWREGNHTEFTLLAIEDITERRRAEQASRDSEGRWQGLFERMAEGFFVGEMLYDKRGEAHDFRFMEVNPAFARLTGVADATGKTVREALPGIEDQLIERYARVVSTGEPETFELFVPILQSRWFDVRARRAEPGRFAVLFLDITERKMAEQEREQLTSELRRSNRELSQFAHTVAHDLQSPIRGITSFAQLLQRRAQGRLASGDREFLSQIIESAHGMQSLVQGLLRFAQVGQGQLEIAPIEMDLIVDAAMRSLQLQISEQGATVSRSLLPMIQGDSVQLLQLLQNLLGNALKYRRSSEPPAITITATEERTHCLFAISDNGEGIAPEHCTKIFEPFKRLHGADVPGTGLGLAVCEKIVSRHGGRIWVESQPGFGSTFYFTLSSA